MYWSNYVINLLPLYLLFVYVCIITFFKFFSHLKHLKFLILLLSYLWKNIAVFFIIFKVLPFQEGNKQVIVWAQYLSAVIIPREPRYISQPLAGWRPAQIYTARSSARFGWRCSTSEEPFQPKCLINLMI